LFLANDVGVFKRGASPSFQNLPLPLFLKVGDIMESLREAKPLFYNPSPFPLPRGRGIKGDGVTP